MSWIEENAERMYPDSDITYGVGAVREAYAYGVNEALKRLAQPEVNSVEELDKLPVGTVVLDRFDYPHLKAMIALPEYLNLRTGVRITRTEFYFPARVL